MPNDRMTPVPRPLRLLQIVVAIAFVYFNSAVLLRSFHVPVPAPLPFYDLFKMNHMFEAALPQNYDVRILGQVEEDADWIDLDTEKHISPIRGRRLVKLLGSRHKNTFGLDTVPLAQEFVARRMGERYNREHPEQPLQRVKFELVAWPLGLRPIDRGVDSVDIQVWELKGD